MLTVVTMFNHTYAQQSGWTCQRTTDNLTAVSFIDENFGLAVGTNGVVLRTTDGGLTWAEQVSGTAYNLNDVQMVSSSVAYAVGEHGATLKSTDGGNSWALITSPAPTATISACFFLSPSGGTVVGPGFISRTVDGGVTWYGGLTGVTMYDVSMFGNGVGMAVGGSASFWKTTNSGLSWAYIDTLPMDARSIVQTTPSIAFAAGAAIFRTTNGGVTWQTVYSNPEKTFNSLDFADLQNGIAVGNAGAIAKTTDGGVSWQLQPGGVSNNLKGVSYPEQLIGVAVGTISPIPGCSILRTTSGGSTWVNQNDGVAPLRFALQQNFPNPFNPSTEIKFSVDKTAQTSLEVFNVLGQRVTTLFNENAEPGMYYSVRMEGQDMASGVYFYSLRSGARVNTRKMILLK